jgi:hypothetical protein
MIRAALIAVTLTLGLAACGADAPPSAPGGIDLSRVWSR